MVYHQSFMVAEVAVGQPVHQTVGERIELLGGAQLRNTSAASAAGRGECGDWNVHWPGQSGGGGRGNDVAGFKNPQLIMGKTRKKSGGERGGGRRAGGVG